ncbi:unnamed protein product [Schistocephalus solidus]|uniref:Uncharacterized protein n=1 Tax=Schistocephalus solidus TaxID=70667 RepID=A0A3P7CNB0_SCHSO|nr:unnamed protein product [Schistocephalus solidus]
MEVLGVIRKEQIEVDDEQSKVLVYFSPTISRCSMATLIGLSIKVKLLRSLPSRFKVRVEITPGTHETEEDINKQLADKERVAAAMENPNLAKMVNICLEGSF